MSDLFRFAQLQPYSLSGAGAVAGATSITLKSMLDIDGTALTMAGTFGDTGFGTLEPGNGNLEEQISFTGLTNNASGTVTLTGVKTVLFTYPYTATSGLAKTHAGSTSFIISNTSGFYDKLTSKEDDETISGTWTFTAVPGSTAAPVAGADLANKTYVDSVVNGGAITQPSVIVTATAGETVVAGNLVYFDETDNEWKKTDADTLATVKNTFKGIAQGSGTDGVAISGGVLIYGLDGTQTGMTQGDIMYASNTAGGVSSTVGTTPVVVGIARTSTSLFFNPYFQNEFYDYAVDAVGTDSYAVTLAASFNAYYPGMLVKFKAGTANTGACSLAVNGGAAKTIKKNVSTDLETGDILASQIVVVVYDGTNFQLASAPSGIVTTATSVPVMQIYTGNSVWTKPTGLKYAVIEVIGGGGGGGGVTNTAQGGGGGGGGGYSRKIIATATLTATVSVTVGASGAGGVGAANGSAGGTSSFGAGPFLQATGGSGGAQGAGGGSLGGVGGVGSLGTLNTEGADGGGGGGTTGIGIGGYGGSSAYGGGGGSQVVDSGGPNGIAGNNYGGGGSGACSDDSSADATGGAGAVGVVVVNEYYA